MPRKQRANEQAPSQNLMGLPKQKRRTIQNGQRLPQQSLPDTVFTGGTPIFDGSVLTRERIEWFKRARFQPIANLDCQRLVGQIDNFRAGYIREFAMTMDAIEKRDDTLQTVIQKRKGAVKRRGYEILIDPEADEAEALRHKEALEYAYAHLKVRNAVDQNIRGGFPILAEQMMDAIGKTYAAHELLWEPSPDGLTLTFNFVPLWFFENRTGRLRFLVNDFDWSGVELTEGAWMTTVGQGAMEACAVAYIFKSIPMKDWLLYCAKHGMPGIQGKTPATKGSDQWNALRDAVQAIAANFSCVTNLQDEIEKIDFSSEGQLPYPELVDRMDRAMCRIWRAGDLSTMSHQQSGHGQGASLQSEESLIVEADDGMLVSSTLNEFIDKQIIEWTFGEGTKPLAYVRVKVPPLRDIKGELEVDSFLMKDLGVELSKKETLERYGRTEPDEDEETVTGQKPQAPLGGPQDQPDPEDPKQQRFAANERQQKILTVALKQLAQSKAAELAPLRERIQGVLEMPNDHAFIVALKKLRTDLPEILKRINEQPQSARVLRDTMGTMLLNAVATGEVRVGMHKHRKQQEPLVPDEFLNSFNPDEPRDNYGKWTSGGGGERGAKIKDGKVRTIGSKARVTIQQAAEMLAERGYSLGKPESSPTTTTYPVTHVATGQVHLVEAKRLAAFLATDSMHL